jgi:N-acyl-D-amino-acid deacylase
LTEKVRAMRDPALRQRLLAEQPEDTNAVSVHTVNNFVRASVMNEFYDYQPDVSSQIGNLAQRRGMTPHEYVYDLLLENEGRTILFYPAANYVDNNLDAAREMVNHPHTVLGLGDGGAHYGLICDASYPTFYLEQYVRDAQIEKKTELGKAIRSLAYEPALAVGLHDRGRLAPGYRADLNVIDLEKLRLHSPHVAYDLPAGGRRLRQEAEGYVCTIKSGHVTYRDGEHTGALPGRLIRWAQRAPG